MATLAFEDRPDGWREHGMEWMAQKGGVGSSQSCMLSALGYGVRAKGGVCSHGSIDCAIRHTGGGEEYSRGSRKGGVYQRNLQISQFAL